MIVRAALCPSPPLLVPELTGQAAPTPATRELRDACAAVVADLVASAPDVVIVVGPADVTTTWDGAARLDLSAYAPALADNSKSRGSGRPTGSATLPLSLGIGALLLDEAGYSGPRLLQSVAESTPPDACAGLGAALVSDVAIPAGSAIPSALPVPPVLPVPPAPERRLALLVMGDGTARRSVSAPGYLDERAEPFDAEVERAFRDGDLASLAALDPELARDLMATGRPAWQTLAGALAAAPRSPEPTKAHIRYSAAPFGVAYLAATLDVAP